MSSLVQRFDRTKEVLVELEQDLTMILADLLSREYRSAPKPRKKVLKKAGRTSLPIQHEYMVRKVAAALYSVNLASHAMSAIPSAWGQE